MVRGTPPGTPSRHRTTNRNFSHESSKKLFPFLSITSRSTRVKPLPSSCYPGIGGRRGATSRSAECRIVPRDFVKTRVREGPSAPESCAGGGDTRPGRYGLLLNQQRLGAPGLFDRPVRAPETKRFGTWGSAWRRHTRLTSGRRFAARREAGCGAAWQGLSRPLQGSRDVGGDRCPWGSRPGLVVGPPPFGGCVFRSGAAGEWD